MSPVPTAGQTVGPFFGYALPFPHDSELVVPGSAGAITLSGVVRDGRGEPVPDAILELWQPDADGNVVRQEGSLRRANAPAVFTGFGRTGEVFAHLKAGITPDLICLSKGLTGGSLPLALTLASEEIFASFLDQDLRTACLGALELARHPRLMTPRAFAERRSWRACTLQFLHNIAVEPDSP